MVVADIFLRLLNVSITAVYGVAAVLLLRLCLKKAPKWISCALWGLVGLRLLLPFSLESPLSLIPSAQTIPVDIAVADTPQIHSGIPPVDNLVNPTIGHTLAPHGTAVTPMALLLQTATVIWLIGMAVMVLYCIYSYFYLYRKVRPSVHFQKYIYQCDYIETPFILGILSPRVYLPSGLNPEQSAYVIAHEEVHIRRRDYLWKPFAFVLLTVYWFNPLLWVAYILLSRDIESACDQRVVKDMAPPEKKAYAEALAFYGNHRKMIAACPLAFGEQGVKDRIKTVLHYKKPTVWLLCAGVAAVLAVAVCFLTDPGVAPAAIPGGEPVVDYIGDQAVVPAACAHTYSGQVTVNPTCKEAGAMVYTCTACGEAYQETVPPSGHRYAEELLQAPTCTQTGRKAYTCSACGEAYQENIPATGHHYGEEEVIKAPTCTQAGLRRYTCAACGDTKTESIAAKGHSFSGGNCTTAAVCSVCGSADIWPAHAYELQADTAPSQYHLGQRSYRCTKCGNVKKELYGGTGVYDLPAIQAAANHYAQERGFHLAAGPMNNPEKTYTASAEYAAAEGRSGAAYVQNLAYTLVMEAYEDLKFPTNTVPDNQLFVEITHSVSPGLTADSQRNSVNELFKICVYVKTL